MRMYLYYVVELLPRDQCRMLAGPFPAWRDAHESPAYINSKPNTRVTIVNQEIEVAA